MIATVLAANDTNNSYSHIAVLLTELGAILFVLGLLGRLARRFKIPVIPVYLLAGLEFGHGGIINLSASEEFINVAANIGVVLLLVMLGLEYSAKELTSNLRAQAPIGLIDGLLNAVPGAIVALVAGWGATAAVALAGITWVSSSGVIAKNLNDTGRLGNRETPTILGVLVIEDLAMAIYLPLLTALLAARGALSVTLAVILAVVTIVVVLIAATRFGEQITALVSSEDPESLLLGVFGLTLLVAGIAEQLKVSAAVGAFLVGIAVSGTVAETAVELLAPLRDLFAAVFFVFFGLSTRPDLLPGVLPLAILLTVVCSGTKAATGYLAARRGGIGRRGRWRAAVALIPRGEFSVVVAALAVGAGAEAQLGPLTAAFVLLTIAVGALTSRLPDRLQAEPARSWLPTWISSRIPGRSSQRSAPVRPR
jgi:monovalent cation:H+ antiporter-2, CPA2 family